ncbi:TIGR03617 family F420-dependent LLM class oxidoreductase [Mycolicibacterium hippocampi]|uniref:TIGR03617 family F420-dependent LLM class oxidoreductase n=1 Tax=Mycolicibacterium hippocampi TaxID=659824 RepID=UPI00351393AF
MEIIASAPAEMDMRAIGDWAARIERVGFDVIHVSETIHDPFAIAAMALARTTRITVRTSMALAFPRSPMIIAYSAWDLAKFSDGRFQLGIASQVRGNIVGRFSTPWSEPVSRLRDYIGSLRAIFHAFQTGEKLDYAGPLYTFDRLQPYFNPGPLQHPPPQIWTGGVNKKMCALAGELSDGFVCHPTNSHPLVLATRTLPAIAEGATDGLRGPVMPAVVANPQPMMAATRDALEALREPRRTELAFLYSTPAYRRQLEHFGLGEVGEVLTAMARRSEWTHLAQHLDDDFMNRIVPQGTFDEIPGVLEEWYSGLCTGLSLPVPADDQHDAQLTSLVHRCKQIPISQYSVPV